jgi:hypothetical protein
MKNVTITMDEKVLRWARIRAVEQDTSLSRMVGDMLRQKMEEEQTYQTAMKQFLSQSAQKLKKKSAKYPKREDLHDRGRFR